MAQTKRLPEFTSFTEAFDAARKAGGPVRCFIFASKLDVYPNGTLRGCKLNKRERMRISIQLPAQPHTARDDES